VGCFLLGIVVITILLMNNDSSSNNLAIPDNITYRRYNPRFELTTKLMAQLTHNNENPGHTLTYSNFPIGHPGHLTLQNQSTLVNIVRSSPIAGNYRFGSTIGRIYIKNTYRYPYTSPEMVGVVTTRELFFS